MNRLLSESEVWAAFRGQKHDLFLPAGGPPNAGVAGLLQVCEVLSHNWPHAANPDRWDAHRLAGKASY